MSRRLGEHYKRYDNRPISEYNSNNFYDNNVNSAYTSDGLSVKQEAKIEYTRIENYLSVSSRERNTTSYPNVNRYTITLAKELRNISEIELIQCIIPNTNNVTNQPYLLLKIEELEDVMISNDRNISDAFAILQMATPVGSFIPMDKRIHENTVKTFLTPKASLSKLSITITDPFGTPFDFGTDSTPINNLLQNTFVFRVVTVEKSRAELNHRNVY